MSAHDEAEALIRRADENAMRGEGDDCVREQREALIDEVRRLDAAATERESTQRISSPGNQKLLARFRTIAPQLADALEAAQASRLVLGHDVTWWKAAWDKATDGKLEGYHRLGSKVATALDERDAAVAALREERLNSEGLRERLAEAKKLAAVRDIALGKLREMADECEAALDPPGGQHVRLGRHPIPRSIIKELRHIADEGNATWTYDEVRKVEARAKAAEERVTEYERETELSLVADRPVLARRIVELEKALEPLADMQLFSEHYAIGAITADQVRAARRALGRPGTDPERAFRMSARYTSAALSRRLHAAGLEQDVTPAANHYHESTGRIAAENDLCIDEECWQFRNCCRALRLDEVLEELTRAREGGPLCRCWRMERLTREDVTLPGEATFTSDPYPMIGSIYSKWASHVDPVEAAGLVLAQLLEARRG